MQLTAEMFRKYSNPVKDTNGLFEISRYLRRLGAETDFKVTPCKLHVSYPYGKVILSSDQQRRYMTRSSDQDRDLQKLILFYKTQADRCGKAQAFFAGCLCLSSALEAGLLAMAGCFEEEVRESQTFRKASKKDPRKWDLDDLLMLASELKWIPSQIANFQKTARTYDVHPDEALKKGDLAYFTRIVKDIRNTIHPGNYLRKWRGTYLGKRYYEFCYTIAELVFDHLRARLEHEIGKTMEKSTSKV